MEPQHNVIMTLEFYATSSEFSRVYMACAGTGLSGCCRRPPASPSASSTPTWSSRARCSMGWLVKQHFGFLLVQFGIYSVVTLTKKKWQILNIKKRGYYDMHFCAIITCIFNDFDLPTKFGGLFFYGLCVVCKFCKMVLMNNLPQKNYRLLTENLKKVN